MNSETACRKIYREAFCDEDTRFEDCLFDTCYDYCKTLQVNGETVSMLFALPCSIIFNKRQTAAIYVYAAATDKRFQGKGYMTQLLEKLKNKTDSLIFLRPANEKLITFYSRMDFIPFETENRKKSIPFVTPEAGYKKLIEKSKIPDDKGDFTLMYWNKEDISLEKLYFVNSME